MSDSERDAAFGALDNYRLLYMVDLAADGICARRIAEELKLQRNTIAWNMARLSRRLGFANAKEMYREYLKWVEA